MATLIGWMVSIRAAPACVRNESNTEHTVSPNEPSIDLRFAGVVLTLFPVSASPSDTPAVATTTSNAASSAQHATNQPTRGAAVTLATLTTFTAAAASVAVATTTCIPTLTSWDTTAIARPTFAALAALAATASTASIATATAGPALCSCPSAAARYR